MSKAGRKPFWEMTTAELARATKEFDEEFAADSATPLSPQLRARWRRAKAKLLTQSTGDRSEAIIVCLDKELLAKCTILARKKRITRDRLITRGLRALLAAEGEGS